MAIAQAFAGAPGRAGSARRPVDQAGTDEPTRTPAPVRIANCSGFYGDRVAAAREMVDGGPIDVLTGDYLAELTMLILWKARQKDPSAGYAKTFLTQMEQVLGTCLDRGIKIVEQRRRPQPGRPGRRRSASSGRPARACTRGSPTSRATTWSTPARS